MAELTLNNKILKVIKILFFYANFGKFSNLFTILIKII